MVVISLIFNYNQFHAKFINGWNSVYEKWIGLKTVLADQIYKKINTNGQNATKYKSRARFTYYYR